MKHASAMRTVAAMMRASAPQSLIEIAAQADVDISTARRVIESAIDCGVVYSPGVGVVAGRGRRPQLFCIETTPFEHEHVAADVARKRVRQNVRNLRKQGMTIVEIQLLLGLGSCTVERALKGDHDA